MKPYYSDNWTTLYNADCREALKLLPAESVNCVVTSPPYFGLRDYGTANWEGGNEDCQHVQRRPAGDNQKSATNKGASRDPYTNDDCRHCGATRIDSQIGLEQTPDDYVAVMVEVFGEVRRVLRSDGTVWLNLGDSYNGSMKGYNGNGTWQDRSGSKQGTNKGALGILPTKVEGLKPKDLMLIPHRVAIALQADGWYVRSDIVWSKPNVLPESVNDRPTKSHEYIFLLSKSQNYYYNADAIKERVTGTTHSKGKKLQPPKEVANTQNGNGHKDWCAYTPNKVEYRNKRSVWTVNNHSYSEAHFATFSPELIKPCILAGCPIGGVVLDPFAGSGTTLQVAMEQGCKSVGIELNPTYCELIKNRMRQPVMNFAEAI